jgi:Cytochrome c3
MRLVMLLCVFAAAAVSAVGQTGDRPRTAPPSPTGETLEVPPPPFSEGIFPCSTCHKDLKPDRTRRELVAFHADIELRHDEKNRWCLDCHNADDRDSLHLAGGQKVSFDESYLLCGQCHGEKIRDWRAGVHGRRTGQWNGHKTYLLCVNCHSPHQPRFKPLEPKPAPAAPKRPGRLP